MDILNLYVLIIRCYHFSIITGIFFIEMYRSILHDISQKYKNMTWNIIYLLKIT